VPLSNGLDTRPCKILDPRLLEIILSNVGAGDLKKIKVANQEAY